MWIILRHKIRCVHVTSTAGLLRDWFLVAPTSNQTYILNHVLLHYTVLHSVYRYYDMVLVKQ